MAENSQQFGARTDGAIRRVNEGNYKRQGFVAYARFLGIIRICAHLYKMELCTNKRKLRRDEKVKDGENVSAVIKRTLPEKRVDLGMFTLPCVIGNKRIERAMLDLGASINVMPYSIYCALSLGPLKETRVVIQSADRSNAYPEGIVEDVLVQVNDLIFPADFYILKMEEDTITSSTSLLLGRPFMKTDKTKIDVDEDTFSIEFDSEIVKFNIFEAMKYPNECHSICSVDIVDSIMQEMFGEEDMNAELELSAQLDMKEKLDSSCEALKLIVEQKAPKLELKTLPDHLKYAYLGDKETLPMIIAKGLTDDQEARLIEVLKEHKMAIGWTLADIKGVSPSICMHRILLKDGAKLVRES
ncbi:PREDICTED: uncharacterized protein LOC104591007 [Nelumbo nucifera]|uniref:Uncharacterized protein LOC104591007 n=1 Tax=Nelumbo nucifera TaxID=4432 RepID=A0A1U7Z4C5_NELNU|nr:PREDICTED: uncharacterized protein LOC104591007 [Nelumbo nucifera]